MVKKKYYGNEGLCLAWDLGINFFGIRNLWFRVLKMFFKDFGFKGVMEKCKSCLFVYLFYKSLFLEKGITGWGREMKLCPRHIHN